MLSNYIYIVLDKRRKYCILYIHSLFNTILLTTYVSGKMLAHGLVEDMDVNDSSAIIQLSAKKNEQNGMGV